MDSLQAIPCTSLRARLVSEPGPTPEPLLALDF
jgi:hypothetical protein